MLTSPPARYHSLLGALGASIHPARRAQDRVFVVIQIPRVYADVSGKAKDDFIVTGAYVANALGWGKFERAWGKILKDADADIFHAKEFFPFGGRFASWKGEMVGSETKQAHFARRFTGAATRYTGFGVAAGIPRRPYDDILERELRGLQRPDARVNAEVYSILNCLAHVDHVARRHGFGVPMAVILEEGGSSGDAIAVLNKLKEVGYEKWTSRFVSFTTMPKSERPLQAADLLAYESWQHVTRLKNPDGRAVRKALESLLGKDHIEIVFVDRDDLEREAPRILRAIRAYRYPE